MRDLGFAEGYRHAHGEQTDMGAYAPGKTIFRTDAATTVLFSTNGRT